MITAFKLLQGFALPSGIVFLALFVGVIFLWTRPGRIGKIIVTFAALFFYVFSLGPVADFLELPLERPYRRLPIQETQNVRTAVLLSGGEEADTLRSIPILELYQDWKRAHVSKIKIVVSGTNPIRSDFDEPRWIRNYLMACGIPASVIVMDRRSLTTLESSINLRESLGTEPFYLATSAYHMTRSLSEFRRLGMNPIPAAADFRIHPHYSILSFFPSIENLLTCNIAVHEYGGLLFYRLLHAGH